MAKHELAILNGTVVLPGGTVDGLNIGASDGAIATLSSGPIDADETIDATGLTVLPGLIDEHFHTFRGYGWETYEGATRAALKGGVTTVIEMPLDKPPTLTGEALINKRAEIADLCHVDYALFGGYYHDDPSEMSAMADAGAGAFKLFTGGAAPPGMFPGVDDGELLDALRRVAELGSTVTVHSENAQMVEFETARLQAEGRTDMGAWDDARPWFSEVAAAQTVALAAQVTGARTVIAHVSSPQTLEAIDAARRGGSDVWAETCHHYLCGSKEDSLSDNRLKWNPPTRDAAAVDWMWELLREGKVHTVASDHAPLAKDPNANVWEQRPGSGNGVEIMFPVFATDALHGREVGIERVAEVMSTNPAKIFRLEGKGRIEIGGDADFAIVETNGSRVLDASELHYHEQPNWSPFEGKELKVYPVYTVLRGKTMYAEGEIRGQAGDGRLLTPPGAATRD